MPEIAWGDPYCADASACFRIGADRLGNVYIAASGAEDRYLADTRDALRALIRDVKAGKADHLL